MAFQRVGEQESWCFRNNYEGSDDKLRQIADLGRYHHVLRGGRDAAGQPGQVGVRSEAGRFTLAKPLFAGLTYPYDWGFIPSTKAETATRSMFDFHDDATYPGLVLKCTPVGVLEVEQSSKGRDERNDRVFVVPDRSPFEGDLQDIRRIRRERSRNSRNSSSQQTRSNRKR